MDTNMIFASRLSKRGTWIKSARFWTIFLAISGTILCLALSLFSYVFNDNMYRQTNALSSSWLPSIDTLSKIRTELNEGRRAEAFLVFGGNCAPLSCSEDARKRREAVFALEKSYGKSLISSAEERVLFEAYVRQRSVYFAVQDDLLEKKADISNEIRKSFLSDSANTYTDVLRAVTTLSDYNLMGARQAQKTISSDYSSNNRLLIYLICILSFILVILFGRVILLITRTERD